MKASIIVFPGSNCDRDIAVSIKKITNCFFNYGWITIIPIKIILNEFDLIFYLLTSLAIVFLSLKLFLKYVDRLIYPDFYKDLDHANQLKH